MSPERLARLRTTSQLLARPARGATPADVLRSIAGAQSQEPRAGRLQVRVRSRALSAQAVEHARIEERSIIRHWLMRGTVHLVPTDDFEWMEPLFAERIAGWSFRRLEVLGVSASERDKALKAIGKELNREGRLSRTDAMAAAETTGLEIDVGLRTHLVTLAVMTGLACIGRDEKGGNTLVARREWLGEHKPREREESLAELARRYFSAFAPASERDFAYWAGLPLRDCRVGMERIARGLAEVGSADQALFAPRGFETRVPPSPVVRLLPAYDTYLMGYASRSAAVSEAGEMVILPGGGVLRPTICVDGRFVGTWRSKKTAKKLTVELEPFEPLDEAWSPALEAEAAEIARFEDTPESAVAILLGP